MVEHVYRRASDARLVDLAIVATDDERIAQVVADFGGIAVMTRDDHATGSDRLAEVAASLESDLIVNVQGDEPLLSSDAIDLAVDVLNTDTADPVSTLRRQITDAEDLDNPAVVKVAIDRAGYALYFSRAPIPYVRSGHEPPDSWRHIGLYVYRRDFLLRMSQLPSTPLERAEGLEQLRILEYGFRIRTVETTSDAIGVDTPDDLERVRRVLQATTTHSQS
jgi:3-deoxy-manno-octulosonate cytidylyltransferase (CMP-KDO synthetase)